MSDECHGREGKKVHHSSKPRKFFIPYLPITSNTIQVSSDWMEYIVNVWNMLSPRGSHPCGKCPTSLPPSQFQYTGVGLGTIARKRFSRWRRVLFVNSAGFFKENRLLVECPWFPPYGKLPILFCSLFKYIKMATHFLEMHGKIM